ncbi:DUF2625 domain-containing protein [Pantoea ananatis]|uniref:DUF2625 domain-containing protein n=1 Tax=Pantoea ananas TaxID=553 RepID=UPI002220100F|nr:DUF2625 domain-containing protein [Pantoea ananatis]
MIDHGLLRILGSGHPRLPRDIVGWNAGRSSGHLLVADDLLGRFFAIDTGALGQDPGAITSHPTRCNGRLAEHYTLGAQLSDHAAHAGADEPEPHSATMSAGS